MNLYDLSQGMRALNNEKKYHESHHLFLSYQENYTSDQISRNKFFISAVIATFIELGNYNDVFKFINSNAIKLLPKDFSFLLKQAKKKPTISWEFINRFCDLVNVAQLDTICEVGNITKNGKQKSIEYASDFENWYASKTKALFELKQYKECYQYSRDALDVIDKFHYANDVWFARRIALSKKALGNKEEALKELFHILTRKKEWYIQYEIAQIYFENTDYDKALQFALMAVLNFGDIEYKVGLIEFIGQLLKIQGKLKEAYNHYILSKLLRIKAQWNVSAQLEANISQFNFSPPESFDILFLELKKFWQFSTAQLNITAPDNIQVGKVIKILHNDERGMDGFIKYGKNNIYFRINHNSKFKTKLEIGTRIKFSIKKSQDSKEKAEIIEIVIN